MKIPSKSNLNTLERQGVQYMHTQVIQVTFCRFLFEIPLGLTLNPQFFHLSRKVFPHITRAQPAFTCLYIMISYIYIIIASIFLSLHFHILSLHYHSLYSILSFMKIIQCQLHFRFMNRMQLFIPIHPFIYIGVMGEVSQGFMIG